jgi:hypothetical protein
VTITGAAFDLGETLSPAVRTTIPEAVAAIRILLAE